MAEQKFSPLKFLSTTGTIMIGASLKLKGLNIPETKHEKIIDIHQHVHYVGRINEQLIVHQRAMGVIKTILLPAEAWQILLLPFMAREMVCRLMHGATNLATNWHRSVRKSFYLVQMKFRTCQMPFRRLENI